MFVFKQELKIRYCPKWPGSFFLTKGTLAVVAHDEYAEIDLDKAKSFMRTPVIVDGRKVFDKNKCMKKGFIFRAISR